MTSREEFEAWWPTQIGTHPAWLERADMKAPGDRLTYCERRTRDAWLAWQAVRSTTPAEPVDSSPAVSGGELHNAIMNLPCKPTAHISHALSYKLGHRDARHAAAELALTVSSPPPREEGVNPMSMDDSDAVAQTCCGEFGTCYRPCTPRGHWVAEKAQAPKTLRMLIDPFANTAVRAFFALNADDLAGFVLEE